MASRVTLRNNISTLWRWVRRRRRLGPVRHVASMNDLPKRLGSELFVVGEVKPKWVVIECPCRCGERIDVNLMTNRRPHWRLSESVGGATLAPSLWMPETKCGSHFFVRNNHVQWVSS